MRQQLADQFVAMNGPLEGVLSFMYTDAENLVTTAMGFLLPTAQSALQLQPYWGTSDQEVLDSYAAVAAGGINSSVNAYKIPGNTARLSPAGIQYATQLRINEDEPILKAGFPGYDDLNAYAQAGLWSMAWAMGPAFWKTFPAFTAAINAGNFKAAARPQVGGQGLGDFTGVGIEPRKQLDDQLWNWAQDVSDAGLNPDQFDWKAGPSASTFAKVAPFAIPIVALAAGAALLDPGPVMQLARAAWRKIMRLP